MGSVCSSSSSSVVSRGRSPVNENNNNDMENGAKRPLPKQPKSKGASPAPAAARAPRRGSATSSLSSFGGAEIPGAVLITGGDGDSEGDRSRPPTPFSRPLTARNVAQRPATTTIFERESDAKRASRSGFSGGAAADPSFPPRPRSRMGMPVSDMKGMNSGATTKADEAFPAIFVGKKSSSLNIHNGDGGRDEEIDKLKRFLQEKGL